MIVHLIDGTYELFRQFYGRRHFSKGKDERFGAVSGVLHSILEMIETGATHVGVATDHVIESFRNDLWPDYKTGEGIEPALLAQFQPLEEALTAMGVVVWPMIELEADDALASAAQIASGDQRVEKVCIWTSDKDLAQCVRGDRVVQVDRKGKTIRDAAGVREKFGVEPKLIPDFLALVGDTADGYPGIAGIGAVTRSEEHTSELQSQSNLVCRLLLEKKKHLRTERTGGSPTSHLRPEQTGEHGRYHACYTRRSTWLVVLPARSRHRMRGR